MQPNQPIRWWTEQQNDGAAAAEDMLLLWKHPLSVSFATSGAIKIATSFEQLRAASSSFFTLKESADWSIWRWTRNQSSDRAGRAPNVPKVTTSWFPWKRQPANHLLAELSGASRQLELLKPSVSYLKIYFQIKASGWTCSNFWSWFKETWPTQIVVWSRSAASQECGQRDSSSHWAAEEGSTPLSRKH